jgi:hypothetical protein
MSLIKIPTSSDSPQDACGVAIQNLLTNQFNMTVNSFNRVFSMVWNNPSGLTPQQVMEGLGTSAGQLFSIMAAMQTAINTIQPGTLAQTAPNQVTINSDGTVTIGASITN